MSERKNNRDRPENRLAVVVMAAGKGKRMKSELPKVMHQVCGKPIIEILLDEVRLLGAAVVVLVVGNGADVVGASAGEGIRCVKQAEPKGTGHAVKIALEEIGDELDEILVLPGDSPLISKETLQRLVDTRRGESAAVAMFTTELEDPTGYGRIVRGKDGEVVRVVEETDASVEEKKIVEVNTSTYVFDRGILEKALEGLSTDNAQGEYYLTGVIEILISNSDKVVAEKGDPEESFGVNDRAQLAMVNGIMRRRINNRLMMDGVTIVDPETSYIDIGIEVGRDTVVMPFTFITGDCSIGERCCIGPSTRINDSKVGNECVVEYSWLDGCELEDEVKVGPYAKLRPGCRIGRGSRAGTFVEMKEAKIGEGSKIPHLSYIGDAVVGDEVNVGAGSITCNYDGERKSRTYIGDRAFLGSDTMMIAPVTIGDDAVTAAGSSITRDVPDGSLGIERAEQKNVAGWRNKKKKKRVDPHADGE